MVYVIKYVSDLRYNENIVKKHHQTNKQANQYTFTILVNDM